MSVLITGAGKGIGMALTRFFLEKGRKVVGISRNITALQVLGREEKYKGNLKVIEFDLQNFDQYGGLKEELKVNSPFEIIIHNAGLLINKPFQSLTAQDLQASYEVNVFSPYLLTKELLEIGGDSMHHIYISSMGGFQGSQKFPGLTAYSPAKAAVGSLAEILAEEFKETDHSFNCLSLGAVKTEMLLAAFPGMEGGVLPEKIAAFIGDFAVNARGIINGKIIPVTQSTP